jgi:hypothetical protein
MILSFEFINLTKVAAFESNIEKRPVTDKHRPLIDYNYVKKRNFSYYYEPYYGAVA